MGFAFLVAAEQEYTRSSAIAASTLFVVFVALQAGIAPWAA